MDWRRLLGFASRPPEEFVRAEEAANWVSYRLQETEWGATIGGWTKGESTNRDLARGMRMLAHQIPLYGVPAAQSERKRVDIDLAQHSFSESPDGSIQLKTQKGEVLFTALAFRKAEVEKFVAAELQGRKE